MVLKRAAIRDEGEGAGQYNQVNVGQAKKRKLQKHSIDKEIVGNEKNDSTNSNDIHAALGNLSDILVKTGNALGIMFGNTDYSSFFDTSEFLQLDAQTGKLCDNSLHSKYNNNRDIGKDHSSI